MNLMSFVCGLIVNILKRLLLFVVLLLFLMKMNFFYSFTKVSKVFKVNEKIVFLVCDFFYNLLSQSDEFLLKEGFEINSSIFKRNNLSFLEENDSVKWWDDFIFTAKFQRFNKFFSELVEIFNDSESQIQTQNVNQDKDALESIVSFENHLMVYSQATDIRDEKEQESLLNNDFHNYFSTTKNDAFIAHFFEVLINLDFFRLYSFNYSNVSNYVSSLVLLCLNGENIENNECLMNIFEIYPKFDKICKNFVDRYVQNSSSTFVEVICKETLLNNLINLTHLSRIILFDYLENFEHFEEEMSRIFFLYHLTSLFIKKKYKVYDSNLKLGCYHSLGRKNNPIKLGKHQPEDSFSKKKKKTELRKKQILKAVKFAKNIQNNKSNDNPLNDIEQNILSLLMEGYTPSMICKMQDNDIYTKIGKS
eukprot:TRINITY_DN245_c0_g1_i1.p1 TRINITY_DN245_c0_g1~~TRINITY_DN245_c0_g1_i1.p1  ORF type:complete len:420 (+),score=82.51 TRINITY_DN245_c0_g1_i1:332-1591(+)